MNPTNRLLSTLEAFAATALAVVALTGCTTTTTPLLDAGRDARTDAAPLDAPADTACVAPQTVCRGVCTDVQTNAANCGTCGNVCPVGVGCVGGACSCAAPHVVCGGACVDAQTDPANCGTCGTACSAGLVCFAGQCTAMCDAPHVLCANTVASDGGVDAGTVAVCADTQTDPVNCGGCNVRCNPGFACAGGHCTCSAPHVDCLGVCADEQTDIANCGICGNPCGPGGACHAGTCTCGPGWLQCGSTCTDVQNDAHNCGACLRPCMAGQSCAMGRCACVAPSIDCGSGCTDLQTDPVHCGACGTNCGPGGVCSAGHCTCAVGLTMCGASCADTQNDPMHCGGCGTACPVGMPFCMAGTCTNAPPTQYMVATPTATTVPFVDACAAAGHTTGLASSDDGSVTATLPFPFRFWATDLPMGQVLTINSNGYILMSASTTFVSLSGAIPPGGTPAMVGVHWSDNYQRTGVCMATVGTAPDRQFVVEWNDAGYCCPAGAGIDLTFEAIFNERTKIIDLVYQTMTGARAAGMGLTNVTGTTNIGGCPGGVGTCIPTTGQRARFVPIP